METTPDPDLGFDEPGPPNPANPGEPRGCLYALSQPPLMLFLAVIATLLALTGAHDLLF
ncbi:hypothetical protein [Streptomyces sulphureus]|uniref:hypothetical protein n=1 Tax=Streptomyces sulphureus TaxID=47758 RepID=UPI0003759296|nr:hypothetical protein [Streptomyces sulphureus]